MIQEGAPDWFTDESFWRELYPFLFPTDAFAIAEEQVEKILLLTAVSCGKVLDLGCGPGRHSIPLAKRGFAVTGVDRSPFLLEKARSCTAEEHFSVEFVLSDMRDFSRENAFDLVVNFFTSFGYFPDKNDDLKVLKRVHQNLKPTGAFFLDVISKEWLAMNYKPLMASKLQNGDYLVQRNEIMEDWTRVKSEWLLIQAHRVQSFRFAHRIFSGQEIKDLLHAACFKKVRLFGDLDGHPYDVHLKRLIAIAWK